MYWYNPETGQLSQTGLSQIEMIEISSTLHAMRFNTTHFSQFIVGATNGGSQSHRRGSSGGGCSLAQPDGTSDSLVEFILPLALLSIIMLWLKRKDILNSQISIERVRHAKRRL